jgi:hypothetical protein
MGKKASIIYFSAKIKCWHAVAQRPDGRRHAWPLAAFMNRRWYDTTWLADVKRAR